MTMTGGWRKSAGGGIGPHRMGTTESLSYTQGATDFNLSTHGALQRSDTPIHRHTMHHTEATKSTNSLPRDIAVFSNMVHHNWRNG